MLRQTEQGKLGDPVGPVRLNRTNPAKKRFHVAFLAVQSVQKSRGSTAV